MEKVDKSGVLGLSARRCFEGRNPMAAAEKGDEYLFKVLVVGEVRFLSASRAGTRPPRP